MNKYDDALKAYDNAIVFAHSDYPIEAAAP